MGKASGYRMGGAPMIIALCLSTLSVYAADVLVPAGGDLAAAVQSAAAGDTLTLEGSPKSLTETLRINKKLAIQGATDLKPWEAIITGDAAGTDCTGNVVENPGFDEGLDPWQEEIVPVDPGYSHIVTTNTEALSPDYVADFKGMFGTGGIVEGIDQLVTLPTLTGLDGEITQTVTIPTSGEGMDELTQSNIIFPDPIEGIDYAYLTSPFNSVAAFPLHMLFFDVARDNTPPDVNDRLEVSIIDGGAGNSILFPIDATDIPVGWERDRPIALLALSPSAFPLELRFTSYTTSGMKFYIDNIRVQGAANPTTPLTEGTFDGGIANWYGKDGLKIVADPYPTGSNNCLQIGAANTKELQLSFQFELFRASGKPNDRMEFFLDGMPLMVRLGTSPTMQPVYNANDTALTAGAFYEATAKLDGFPRGAANPHTLTFRSYTTPSAAAPDAPTANTTVFIVDDVCLQIRDTVSSKFGCVLPPSLGVIANGDFDSPGAMGAWMDNRAPGDYPIIGGYYSSHSPTNAAHFGGLPPPQFSCSYKAIDTGTTATDLLTIFFDDETIPAKRMLQSGADTDWAPLKLWLIDPSLADGMDHVLYIKAHVDDPIKTAFLVDDLCVSRSDRYAPMNCPDNQVSDSSFESGTPNADWTESQNTVTQYPLIACYDPADNACNAPSYAFDGKWMARFGGFPAPNIRFMLKMVNAESTGAGQLQVCLDDLSNLIYTVNESEASSYSDYKEVVIPASSLNVSGGQHLLKFVCNGAAGSKSLAFLLDNVCISKWAGADPGNTGSPCPDNVVGNGGFEAGRDGAWTETAAVDDHIIQKDEGVSGEVPYEGSWFAKLQVAGDRRTLTQADINFPSDVKFLVLHYRIVAANSTGTDTLTVYIDDNPVQAIAATAVTAGWNEISVDVSAYAGGTHTLKLESITGRAPTPTEIWVDDICLSAETGKKFPLIEVDGASVGFTLANLSVQGGSVGLLGTEAGAIGLNRCYFTGQTDSAVQLGNQVDGASISQSAFSACGNTLEIHGNTAVNLFQCTMKGTSGVNASAGRVNVIACLLDGGSLNGSEVYSYSSWDVGAGGAAAAAHMCGGDPPSDTQIVYLDDPWVGKLDPDITSLVKNDSGTTVAALRALTGDCAISGIPEERIDMDGDGRREALQMGADELGGISGPWLWTGCSVTPSVPANVGNHDCPVVTSASFVVTVTLTGSTGSNMRLILVPQEYQSHLTIAELNQLPEGFVQPLSFTGDTGVGKAFFSVSKTFVPDPLDASMQLCLDGRARVYLYDGSTVYGYGADTTRLLLDQNRTEFILDSVPPVLDAITLNSAANGLVTSNDSLMPSSAETFPGDWVPGAIAAPYTVGTPDLPTSLPQIFFNNDPTSTLAFTVTALYIDPSPRDNTNRVHYIEVSDFQYGATASATASTAEEVERLLAEGPYATNVDTGTAGPQTGVGLWADFGALSGELSESGITTSLTQSLVTGTGGSALQAVWSLSGMKYAPDWHFSAKLGGKDLAGNLVNVSKEDPLHFWWMRDPLTELSSTQADLARVADPSFAWKLYHVGSGEPQEAANCLPIGQFRVWQAVNPLDPDNTAWVPAAGAEYGWSGWTYATEINSDTVVYDNSPDPPTRLAGILANDANRGALLLMTVRGADSAGNVQLVGSWSASNKIQSLAELEPNGSIPATAYLRWYNPGGESAIDTGIQARFWYNRTDNVGNLYGFDPEYGERDFGSSRRIPLAPADNCALRIEGEFLIQVKTPDVSSVNKTYYVDFQLFEDGQLVYAGRIEPEEPTVQLLIPQHLLYPPANLVSTFSSAFLRTGPNCVNVADRLGDDGDDSGGQPGKNTLRRRDVEYVLTARVTELYQDATSGNSTLISDPSPAMVQFTVAAPTSRKDEQPIKMFKRE